MFQAYGDKLCHGDSRHQRNALPVDPQIACKPAKVARWISPSPSSHWGRHGVRMDLVIHNISNVDQASCPRG